MKIPKRQYPSFIPYDEVTQRIIYDAWVRFAAEAIRTRCWPGDANVWLASSTEAAEIADFMLEEFMKRFIEEGQK